MLSLLRRNLAPGLLAILLAGSCAATPADAAARGTTVSNGTSAYGSGNFGHWFRDRFGLPAYSYESNDTSQPAPASSQVGNSNITAFGFADGYTQLYTQARYMQWVNAYDPQSSEYAGGFGFLKTGDRVISTLYADRPADAIETRTFGVGYYSRTVKLRSVSISETVYAPYGDDPVLLHDVVIENRSNQPLTAAWFEYWGVNPVVPANASPRGLEAASWNQDRHILSVRQQPTEDKQFFAETPVVDSNPEVIFAAPLSTATDGFETSAKHFFGAGTRAAPDEVVQDRLSNTLAGSVPRGEVSGDMLGFRTPISLGPHQRIVLRYVYGIAHAEKMTSIVSKFAAEREPLERSAGQWRKVLPEADLGPDYDWVGREVAWDAYLVNSAAVYEEACGYHTITQGGYYQYEMGYNWGTRSWTHYIMAVLYSDPALARDIVRYTAHLQPANGNLLPYGTGSMCTRSKLPNIGTPNDSDLWFIFAAAQYALASRDLDFLKEKVAFYDTGAGATIWEHLKLAFLHQKSLLGPHGGYLATPDNGTDWSDGLTTAAHQTESLLVTAQAAYTYPLLAELAEMIGDRSFANQVGRAADGAKQTMRKQWIDKGWYARGLSGDKQIGAGVLFEEPQPWAILAGVPTTDQADRLTGNILRFLTGVGAPPELNGPSKLGSAQVPARADPDVTERCSSYDFSNGGFVDGAGACWAGGNWFDLNGNLVWALSTLDGKVPNAARLAWDEYLRNSLAAHASAFPGIWDGITSVDDVCASYYDLKDQGECGLHLTNAAMSKGHNSEQPTWMVANLLKLAGVSEDRDGYVVDPHLPMERFSVRFPAIGVWRSQGGIGGYLQPAVASVVRIRVHLAVTPRVSPPRLLVDGKAARLELSGDWASFVMPLHAGRKTEWVVRS